MIKLTFLFTFFVLTILSVTAQEAGQTPGTAFPVCGTSVFEQKQVPDYVSHNIIVPGCSGAGGANYQDMNPYWYKFTCFTAGTLGFTITPKTSSDDYDWQLYDITGHNPDDVFTTNAATASGMIIVGNWCATPGATGASANGTNNMECASNPAQKINPFSKMPTLVEGHTYILLVSHYTSTNQSGYDLSFTGGTAVITDTKQPALQSARIDCSHQQLFIKLNKKMMCSSLAPNGSDFALNTTSATITKAVAYACTGFDMDSVILTFSNPLTPGSYTISMQKGNDANTLFDICQTPIPDGNSLSFVVHDKDPTKMDSIIPLPCAPQTISVIFDKNIQCSTVAPNGSNFKIDGSYPVNIQSVTMNCNANGLSPRIDIQLASPLVTAGNFTITLINNTIIDECQEPVPPSQLSFSVKDTVNASFTYNIHYGCKKDTINYFLTQDYGIDQWKWSLDENQQSTIANPQGLYNIFSEKNIQSIVSNGFCSDTSSQKILLDNYLKADFDVPFDNCPLEDIKFTDNAIGKNITRNWSFGDNTDATDSNPVHAYKRVPRTTIFNVIYTITDEYGCTSSIEKQVSIYVSCIIDVPNAFTPNGDGVNDVLYPLNAVKATNLSFKVFNRWGQQLFLTDNWKNGWNGTFGGQPQASGIYVWVLSYDDRDSKKHFFKKGTVMLMR